jgi:hypothetical protein
MIKKFLLVSAGLSLLLGACAILIPESASSENEGLSAVIYKDPT